MFYLNVFYLPTLKDVAVNDYKLWNELMFWFTQMMCYNVYMPPKKLDMCRNAG